MRNRISYFHSFKELLKQMIMPRGLLIYIKVLTDYKIIVIYYRVNYRVFTVNESGFVTILLEGKDICFG